MDIIDEYRSRLFQWQKDNKESEEPKADSKVENREAELLLWRERIRRLSNLIYP